MSTYVAVANIYVVTPVLNLNITLMAEISVVTNSYLD